MEKKSVRYKLERHRWPDEIAAEKRRRRLNVITVFAIIAAFVLGMYGGQLFQQPILQPNSQLTQLERVYQIMKNDWYYGKDIADLDSKLIADAINGMMQGEVDPHTYYMNQDEATQFVGSMAGSLTGIGASFYEINGDTIIEKTYPGSPARKAGILPGDIFYEVDGTSVKGMKSTQLQSLVLGEKGTIVKITVDRQGEKIPFEITRDVVLTSVMGEVVDGNIGMLEINSVAENTATEVENYFKDFQTQGVNRLVIDLRNNTGGYLSTLEQIGDLMFQEGSVIIQQEFRNGSIAKSKSKGKKPYTFEKIVVLINENTASAAEALAAALRENIQATLVGVTTYGKGSVQQPKTFEDRSVLKYTIAQWLTPLGNKINHVGIAPDVEVKLHGAYLYRDITLTKSYQYDDVNYEIIPAQMILQFMNYNPGRTDGYFNDQTKQAIQAFQTATGVTADGILDQETMNRLLAANLKYWYDHRYELDEQKIKAMELIRSE